MASPFRSPSCGPWQRRWALLLGLVGALGGCAPEAREESAPGRPRLAGAARGWNVILLSLDTVRADRLGAYGYARRDTTPELDALLGRGVRFASAMAPRAATWPSMATALTGLYPTGHGVIENGYGFPPEVPVLSELLRAAGYRTGAFLSNMCRARHRGWDERFCTRGMDVRIRHRAMRWLRREDGDRERPFFLWAHYFAAHPHYYNGGGHADELVPGYQGPVRAEREALDRIMLEGIPLDGEDLEYLDALYDAALMGTDRMVGRFLERLRAEGFLERTVVVLLADHGEDLYSHNRYLFHVCSVYQTTLHVPLAFVAPGLLPEGAVVSPTVELADVTPTLLELLGLEAPAEVHGKSLVPYLERPGAGGEGWPAYSEWGDTRIRTVLAGDWKLIVNPDRESPVCLEGAPEGFYPIGERELYHLAEDPGESRNLAGQRPEKVRELRDLLQERFASLTNRQRVQELSEDLREELRALGYVAN